MFPREVDRSPNTSVTLDSSPFVPPRVPIEAYRHADEEHSYEDYGGYEAPANSAAVVVFVRCLGGGDVYSGETKPRVQIILNIQACNIE